MDPQPHLWSGTPAAVGHDWLDAREQRPAREESPDRPAPPLLEHSDPRPDDGALWTR